MQLGITGSIGYVHFRTPRGRPFNVDFFCVRSPSILATGCSTRQSPEGRRASSRRMSSVPLQTNRDRVRAWLDAVPRLSDLPSRVGRRPRATAYNCALTQTSLDRGVMSQEKPAQGNSRRRSPRDRNIIQGDIVVTAVARVYAIGRITGDGGIQESLGSDQNRTEALKRACALAGATHRVFLYPSTGSPVHLQFECPKVST